MSSKKELEIYETAIACAFYRMKNEDLSQDPYAKFLVNEKIKNWAELYRREVSEVEDIAHSLRHRFFLEELKTFFNRHNEAAFINFGAGFSFYPFLLEGNHIYIEIDQLELIKAKKNIIKQLTETEKLPVRNIHYLEGNLNDEKSFAQLGKTINRLVNRKSTFILIEGVIFYLNKEILPNLFALFASIQKKDDVLGSVSYIPEISSTRAYKKLSSFFKNHLHIEQQSHTNLEPNYYKAIENYDLIKHEEYFNLYHTFVNKNCPDDSEDVLNEHMYLLKRKK